jgi:hypothetical protein
MGCLIGRSNTDGWVVIPGLASGIILANVAVLAPYALLAARTVVVEVHCRTTEARSSSDESACPPRRRPHAPKRKKPAIPEGRRAF